MTPAEVTVLDFGAGFTPDARIGGGVSAGYVDGDLHLTDGPFQARAAWAWDPVNVGNFHTTFVFRLDGEPGRLGDGFTFALRGGTFSPNPGTAGAGLGYQGLTDSVAVKFDLVDNEGEGGQSVGVFTGGAAPTIPAVRLDGTPVHLHSQHPIRADLRYDGATLTVTLTDTTAPDQSVTHRFAVDIPAAVGGPTAFAGFTAGTGELFARQAIESWTFAAEPNSQPPEITGPINVSLIAGYLRLYAPVTDDGGAAALKYLWEVVSSPPGQPPYITQNFRPDGWFMLFEYGTYTFRLTVRDADGQTATREVSYTKVPTPVRFEITPRDARVPVGGTVQFRAIGYDERGNRMPNPIGVGWYIWQGPGTIDYNGLYTAPPALSGAVTIHAEMGLSDGIHAPIPVKDEVVVVIEPAIAWGGELDFTGGFAGADLARNGSAQVVGDRLRLADGPFQAGSAFTPQPVEVRGFATSFDFRVGDVPEGRLGDGLTFVIQGVGPDALGAAGEGLGYAGIGQSVAVKFDLVDNAGEGTDSVGMVTGGAAPTTPADRPVTFDGRPIRLHSGHVLQGRVTYAGGILRVGLLDTVDWTWFSQSYAVDLPAAVGGTTARIGFTAGTGELFAPIDVLSWTYTPTDNWFKLYQTVQFRV